MADYRAFYDSDPPISMRALVGELDGEVVSIGGYYLQTDHAIAFTEIKEGRLSKRDVIRGGRAVMQFMEDFAGEIYARADEAKHGDTAVRHWGWEPVGDLWRRA